MKGTTFYSEELGCVCTVTRYRSDRRWKYRTNKNEQEHKGRKRLSYYLKTEPPKSRTLYKIASVLVSDAFMHALISTFMLLTILAGRYFSFALFALIYITFALGRILQEVKQRKPQSIHLHIPAMPQMQGLHTSQLDLDKQIAQKEAQLELTRKQHLRTKLQRQIQVLKQAKEHQEAQADSRAAQSAQVVELMQNHLRKLLREAGVRK